MRKTFLIFLGAIAGGASHAPWERTQTRSMLHLAPKQLSDTYEQLQ